MLIMRRPTHPYPAIDGMANTNNIPNETINYQRSILAMLLLLSLFPFKGAIPGTFFWRPRMGIDLAMPTTEAPRKAFAPNKQNIQAGLVVLIDGYDIMTSILGLLRGSEFAADDDAMDPASSIYYTGIYRWTLRTMELLPHWLRGNFQEALGVWNGRFKYMEAEVPEWMKKVLPWVPKKSWDTNHEDMIKFRKLAETAFTQFYRYPSKTYTGFNSFLPDSDNSLS
ncbi:uncharacterized protein LOC134661794 [Cydia amplana]|uniref:uncharacterized protein LOC134661794 n=1 Tax=Cydia amplana TaxID=1869771 RepID=UPI002FE51937